ncbi:hypothetical protein, partial [Geobacillus stearothermophilus]|uniref:hypothetical protein n=1 Tax=Geobacillus stearothermophilus TaxID=1422 RepID=UPI002E247282|nr:hypothetical protein [Geobacillus stearothermophilus]
VRPEPGSNSPKKVDWLLLRPMRTPAFRRASFRSVFKEQATSFHNLEEFNFSEFARVCNSISLLIFINIMIPSNDRQVS